MGSIVVDRVAPDLVGTIVMRPQDFGRRRITIDDLEPETMTLLDEVGHRLKADLEFIDLIRYQRLRVGVAVVGHSVRAARRVEGAMRRAQPTARDEFGKRIKSLAAIIWRLRKLIAELDEEIGVTRGR